MRRLAVVGVTAVLAVGAAVSVAEIASSKATGPATVKTRSTALGTILVDGKGRTLYLFEKDRGGRSACSGQCAVNWPPTLTKGHPRAGGKARKGELGTTRRSNGTTQVTYNGHPVYTFIADRGKPGATKGQGVDAFGAEWYVMGPNGHKIEKSEH